MAPTVKEVEGMILSLCRDRGDGTVANDALESKLVDVSLDLRVEALNSLLSQKRLQLFTNASGKIHYKEVKQEEAVKYKGLSPEDLLILQCIKGTGNKGMWTKDMKYKTNLSQPQITKILKTLESKKLVKAVKSVINPTRKVYMLYELEPSREVTGGAWYTENQFDSEFIEVLREACYKYICKQKDATLREVALFIRAKGFSKVDLRDEDIMSVVSTLIYDGRVDQVDGEGEDDTDDHFRPAVLPVPQASAFTSVPCGVCPVFSDCREGGLISPQTCVYYDEWLNF